MKLPPDDTAIILTKFDVAERQLFQAIKMFFAEEDAVSIHTLSEAAGQIFHDIGKNKGVLSLARDYEGIRPERKKEWLAAVFASRNYFKHADKDPDGLHEFKSVFNDFSLFDAINMYSSLKKKWAPESLIFTVWFGLQHSSIVKESSDLDDALKKIRNQRYGVAPENKAFFGRLISALRSGEISAPNVTLVSGIADDA